MARMQHAITGPSALGRPALRLCCAGLALWALAGALPAQSVDVINIRASRPVASEQGGSPGAFTLTRSGSSGALTVAFRLGGDAVPQIGANPIPGDDYYIEGRHAPTGFWRALFPDGQTAITVAVIPRPDDAFEGRERVVAALVPYDDPLAELPQQYTLGGNTTAEVVIADDEQHVFMNITRPTADEHLCQTLNFGTFDDPLGNILGIVQIGLGQNIEEKLHWLDPTAPGTVFLGVEFGGSATASEYDLYFMFLPFTDDAQTDLVTTFLARQWLATVKPNHYLAIDSNGKYQVLTRPPPEAGADTFYATKLEPRFNPLVGPAVNNVLRFANQELFYGIQTVTTVTDPLVVNPDTGAVIESQDLLCIVLYQNLHADLSANLEFSNRFKVLNQGPGLRHFVEVDALAPSIAYMISPKHDLEPEGAQDITLRFIESPDYAVLEPNSGTVILRDDDTIADVVLVNNGSKPDYPAQVKVRLSQALPQDVVVPFETDAIGFENPLNPDDYEPLGNSVTVPAGATEAFITIRPRDDNDPTDPGTGSLRIRLLESPDYLLAGADDAGQRPDVIVNIYDIVGTVSLECADTDIGEETSTATTTVELVLTRNIAGAVAVSVQIQGTATRNVDFRVSGTSFDPSTDTVTVPAGTNRVSLTLTAIDDAEKDLGEKIEIAILPGPGYQLAAPPALTRVEVTISDNEPVVSITAPVPNTVNEGDSRSFLLSYTGTSQSVPLEVAYTISGSATADGDYDALEGIARIPVSGSVEIQVRTRSDDLEEDPEDVILQVTPSDAYYVDTEHASATISIVNVTPVNGAIISELRQGHLTAGSQFSATVRATTLGITLADRITAVVLAAPGASAAPDWVTINPHPTIANEIASFPLHVDPPLGMDASHVRFRIVVRYSINGDQRIDSEAIQDLTLYIVATPSAAN